MSISSRTPFPHDTREAARDSVAAMPEVHVRLTGTLAQRLGARRAVALAQGATVDDLVAAIAREAGFDPAELRGLAVVSGGAFLSRDREVADGEELDVLVPVSGG
jgi:molybdopterin converting factor small subunit